jgi:hypothetical protein
MYLMVLVLLQQRGYRDGCVVYTHFAKEVVG